MSIILRTSNLIISGNTSFIREKIKTIDVGENHTLFLTDYGRVYGCGDNKYGQLGSTINNDTAIANPVPTQITETIGSLNIVGIAAGGIYGGDHSLFLTHDGKVYGCGHNGSGQLGKAVSNINPVPAQITATIGSLNIVQVACGGGASLFLTNNGRVYSCGYNRYGNLGLVDNIWIHDPLITPKLVIDINGVSFSTIFISKIRASSQETFFITNDGRVFACGYNFHGQLGHTGSNGNHDYPPNLPRQVMSSFYVVDGAPNGSSYFLTNTGKVYSCGANDHAQLGYGSAGALKNPNPQQITANNFGSLNIVKVVSGSSGGRFLASDGKLYGVGYNADGRIGLGNTTNPIGSPTQITGALNSLIVSDVFGYGLYCNFNYVITTNNNLQSIYNFGNNRFGQLGRTTNNDTDTIINTSTLLPIEISLPSTGQISLSNTQSILGGTNPIAFSEYYQNAASGFTNGISGISNINSQITLNFFRGKNKAAIIVQSGGTILPQSIVNTTETYLSFPHNGSQYTIQCLRNVRAQILVVAGGGAGGRNDRADNRGGGGGGAGGLIYMQNYILVAGTHTIIVGNGGTRGSSRGNNGGNSSFGSIVATGGGGGGGANVNTAGSNGGSGGGGGDYGGGGGAGTGTANQGFNGGNSDGNSGYGGGGGGGGGGSASLGESSPSSGYIFGLGGNGRSINITGTSTTYAKGGNGGPWYGGGNAVDATANLGNGGDGARFANAGNGGTGIIIIRYTNN
jgi:alpha-tubulin suppressor-like RCC1 family protein